jgi:hypothetical protein
MNSPIKPFSSGNPTDDSMMNAKKVAYTGMGVARPPYSPMS